MYKELTIKISIKIKSKIYDSLEDFQITNSQISNSKDFG